MVETSLKNGDVILSAKDLTKQFRGLTAVSEFNLDVREGEIVGLIGPNGAGKTTVFNMLTGVLRPSSGSVSFRGREISTAKPSTIASIGVARTFQNIRLFGSLTVLQNVMIGAQLHKSYGFGSMLFSLPDFSREEERLDEKSVYYLDYLGLERHRNTLARNLSYGDQRRLEIARALATNPTLLMLDEPAAGMNPNESSALMEMIRRIRETFKLTILLIEHDMKVVMGLCERILVLNYGRVIAEGPPEEIRGNAAVVEAYLGRFSRRA